METRIFQKGELVFSQGEQGKEMYDILSGSVGIFLNYGEAEQRELTILREGSFGELALLDGGVRSATAVALEAQTELAVLTAGDFAAYFRDRPAQVRAIMRRLSGRIRLLTRDYLEACKTLTETADALEKGQKRSGELAEKARYFAKQYRTYGSM